MHSAAKSTLLRSRGSSRGSGEEGGSLGSMDDEKEMKGEGGLLGGAFSHLAYPSSSSSSLSSYVILAIVDNIICAFHKDTSELGKCSLQ